MERIPILRMGEFLLVTIQVDMHDQLALRLQDDLSNAIQQHTSRGVLIDISALEMVDSFIGRMVSDISGMAKILGAETVLVGMQPAVAITLVELGLSLTGVVTALNPVIGYDRATELAAEAMKTGRGIMELVREKKILTEQQIAQVLDPVAMTGEARR